MKPILLVQFRTDLTGPHEVSCFQEEFKNVSCILEVVNAVTGTLPTDLSSYAGIILGGSGEFYLSEGHGAGTWREETFAFITRARIQNIPLLGICFGFQLLGRSYGASVVRDESMRETGSLPVTLYPVAKSDILFQKTPPSFFAQFAHKDTLINFPDSLIPLASSEKVLVEAFRVDGILQWGVLFHPELTEERMRVRLQMLSGYTTTSVDVIAFPSQDTRDATAVLHTFIQFASSENVELIQSEKEIALV